MSILIKGMEMPKSCHCCRMCVQVADGDIDWHWECCLLCEKVERYAADRIPGCPLVPIQKRGRLIDADALFDFILNIYKTAQGDARKAYRDVLDTIVAAGDVIPAEEEYTMEDGTDIQKRFLQNWHEEDE